MHDQIAFESLIARFARIRICLRFVSQAGLRSSSRHGSRARFRISASRSSMFASAYPFCRQASSSTSVFFVFTVSSFGSVIHEPLVDLGPQKARNRSQQVARQLQSIQGGQRNLEVGRTLGAGHPPIARAVFVRYSGLYSVSLLDRPVRSGAFCRFVSHRSVDKSPVRYVHDTATGWCSGSRASSRTRCWQ